MTPQQRSVDVAILGAGTAGLTARRAVKRHGKSALLIDPGPLGTTCARVGCMPSKLLIAAAETAYHARHSAVFGVHTEAVRVDGPQVLARVRAERDRFVGFVLESNAQAEAAGELLRGRGRITGPSTLLVDTHTEVTFQQLVIATGTTPFIPPPFRPFSALSLTNEEIFELPDLPERVLVIGTGVIGLELGQALTRLGVSTTILGSGGVIGPLRDPVVKKEAARIFGAELDLHPDYTLHKIEAVCDGLHIVFTDSAGRHRDEVFPRLLIAAGRRSTLGSLGLEAAGLEPIGPGRYPFDPETLQIGDMPFFVAGDANEAHPLLHEAADDGHFAGENAARFPHVQAFRRRTSLGVVFTDPQIATVGGGWGALAACDARVGEVDYGDQGRARVMNRHRGRVRIYGQKGTGLLLGAEMLGPDVEHTAHLLAWAIQSRMSVFQALEMPFYHPVVEEGIRTALRDLEHNLRYGPPVGPPCDEVGPGA